MNEGVAASPSGGRILVVDDEPRNVQLLQELLESRGYTVWITTDGEQGLAAALVAVPASGSSSPGRQSRAKPSR